MACEHTQNELAPMAAGLSGPLKSPKPSFLSKKGQSYLQRAIICAQHRKQKADVVTFIVCFQHRGFLWDRPAEIGPWGRIRAAPCVYPAHEDTHGSSSTCPGSPRLERKFTFARCDSEIEPDSFSWYYSQKGKAKRQPVCACRHLYLSSFLLVISG